MGQFYHQVYCKVFINFSRFCNSTFRNNFLQLVPQIYFYLLQRNLSNFYLPNSISIDLSPYISSSFLPIHPNPILIPQIFIKLIQVLKNLRKFGVDIKRSDIAYQHDLAILVVEDGSNSQLNSCFISTHIYHMLMLDWLEWLPV